MISSLLFLALSVFPSHATTENCSYDQSIGDGVVANRFNTVALGCVVQITPRKKPELRYRDYWIDERGRFLAFSSVSGNNIDTSTGARTYFFFPRKTVPSFQKTSNGDISLTLPSGQRAVFSGLNARLVSFPGEFTEDSNVTLENQGGLEFKSFQGIRLDAGWMIGNETYKSPNAFSKISDPQNRMCMIRNDEFFAYESMYYNEPNLRYPNDAGLKLFLQGRCPDLDLATLQ